ncbi:carbohydrate kinase, FGGY family protein [Ancylostoma duodenale]|uniref:Carbohydrate kinase, FGGY family protein n=1 Tax=Ancylostoma duodenale TaxID=51022 RepID=A0A0C2H331_9BILA|nr:carbohydrate kinase, FGGY family protein [Ancylostoma duodenale]
MRYIVSVDIGTTTIRACLYDEKCRLVDTASDKVYYEFRTTNETLTKIICWSDGRARAACTRWNKSFTMKCYGISPCDGYDRTGMSLYNADSSRFPGILKDFQKDLFTSNSLIDKNAGGTEAPSFSVFQSETMQGLLDQNQLGFGCLDTWLLLKLTDGKIHVAEASNYSSSGMFDPFLVVIFLADQQSALYGSGGWRRGDVKAYLLFFQISLGTGTFVDLNTGSSIHASMNGLYPLVGWRFNNKPVFVAEGNDHDTAVVLKWAQSIGLFSNVTETANMARSVPNSNGVLFVPAFGGLQTPINDDTACCGFLGIRPDTTKAHMSKWEAFRVRAILESIAFRVYQIFETMRAEVRILDKPRIRICGGVAANDFICETVATLTGNEIHRMKDGGFVASRGAALLAGFAQGGSYPWWRAVIGGNQLIYATQCF